LLIIKAITANIITTKNIPTPIPALNIPPIIEQLVAEIKIISSNAILVILSYIISWF
jgi:hypothetical protein